MLPPSPLRCELPRTLLLKLFGKSERAPLWDPTSQQSGARSALIAALRYQKHARQTPPAIFQTVSLGSSLSSGATRRPFQICHEALEDGIGDAPLEAPQRFLTGFALCDLLAVVGPAPNVRPGLADGDHVQGVIEPAVSGQREPVTHHLAARDLHRRRAAVGGKVGLSREACRVADRAHDLCGQYGAHAKDLGEAGGGSLYLGFDPLV